MNKFLKIFISTLLIAWLWYAIYATFFKKSTKNTTKTITYSVKKWDLEDSIKVTWVAKLVNEQQIRFNQAWEVKMLKIL